MSMNSILSDYKNEYKYINDKTEETNIIETNKAKYFDAYNIAFDRKCVLKVIDKKKLEDGDFDFLMEQINNEEKLTKICNSQNTVNFYRRLENQEFIVFELESCSQDLNHYKLENGELKYEKTFFSNKLF